MKLTKRTLLGFSIIVQISVISALVGYSFLPAQTVLVQATLTEFVYVSPVTTYGYVACYPLSNSGHVNTSAPMISWNNLVYNNETLNIYGACTVSVNQNSTIFDTFIGFNLADRYFSMHSYSLVANQTIQLNYYHQIRIVWNSSA